MKIFIVFLFIASASYANLPSQNEVRSAFQKAATQEKSCKVLINTLHAYNEKNNPLLGGYKACATMMMANYVFSPFNKLSHFSKGRSLLEKCINADKKNIELRFLRYTVQKNAPFFLQYRSSLEEDEGIITRAVVDLKDTELKKIIVDFLKFERVIK